MYNNILYPTDGSIGADAALDHARELALQNDATVHILHVINNSYLGYENVESTGDRPGMLGRGSGESTSPMADSQPSEEHTGMVGEDPSHHRAEVRERAESIVTQVEGQCNDVRTESYICAGKPHQVILSYADHHNIDIIVMGTHGRAGLERYLLGSVTEKVVRMSDVPVVTVRRDAKTQTEATA